jgi:hypothetical protein
VSHDNPARRSWQRKPPLSPEQETAKHSRRVSRPKRYGLVRVSRHLFFGKEWTYTSWYETERARDEALAECQRKGNESCTPVERP